LARAYPPLGHITVLLLTQQFLESNAISIPGCMRERERKKNTHGHVKLTFGILYGKRVCTLVTCDRDDLYECRTGQLKCDGIHAETRFCLSAKRTSPIKSAGASVQSTSGSRGVRISGSNAGYTMFRGSVKCTGHPLHSPVSPSLPHPCVTVCRHISTGVYHTRPFKLQNWTVRIGSMGRLPAHNAVTKLYIRILHALVSLVSSSPGTSDHNGRP
jgi:hypothetical protein